MSTFQKLAALLFGTVSTGTLFARQDAEKAAAFRAETSYGHRPTPRKPERRKATKVASAHRALKRGLAAAQMQKQQRKEAEIGIDPIYMNGDRAKREQASKAWRPVSREWDRVNSKAFV